MYSYNCMVVLWSPCACHCRLLEVRILQVEWTEVRASLIINSISRLLSNWTEWDIWNALFPRLIVCSRVRSINSRYLYFMNANLPISMPIRFVQFVTRSLPLPPLNPPFNTTTLSKAPNPLSSNTDIPYNAFIPIVRFFTDCCWFSTRLFFFDIGNSDIRTSSTSFGILFNSAWFRIITLDDGTWSLKLI